MKSPELVPLYRLENTSLPFDQQTSQYFDPRLAGQWFDIELRGAIGQSKRVWRVDCDLYPAQLAVASLAIGELSEYHASVHPIASTMSYFQSDYIVPRDGSVDIVNIDINHIINKFDYPGTDAMDALQTLVLFTMQREGLYVPTIADKIMSFFKK